MPLSDLLVVSHTHWDREWYHTEERFRQRLVRLIDDVLDNPPLAGESFLLDGQAVLLEDYLAVRPERAADIVALLRDGGLETGPWYVLADELIPSGEALVRNLLVGRDTLRRLRGAPPPVLYCPDSFGHPAILPEIAVGFGYDLVVIWRGLGGARSPGVDLIRWRGPANGVVLVYHLPPDGYEFGSSLPTALGEAATRWKRIADVLAPRAITGTAILLNGADHHARQDGRDDALKALAVAAAPTRVKASSLRSAALALVEASRSVELPEVEGELRDSYGYAWTLQGTFGTRAAQKRRNARAERTLIRDVEPWVALSQGADDTATHALLRYAWRTLLQAHPHDTLCGTSIDAVAAALEARLASAEEQSSGLREHALHRLIEHDRDRARAEPAAWKPSVMLRNPVARPRGGAIELTLRATLADIAVGPGSATRQGSRRRVPMWRVAGVPLQVLSRSEQVELTESPQAYPDADLVREATAVGWIDQVGGYVVETRAHARHVETTVPHPVVCRSRTTLDNGRLRIEVADHGRISLVDHELGRRLDGVVSLECTRDVGDSYTPALRESLSPPRLRRIRLIHRGPIRGEVAVDYIIGERTERTRGTCRVGLQLDANARAMRIIVHGMNRARDHRLRFRVATGLASASTVADAAFLPVSRTALSISEGDAAMERVVPTAPLHRWVARFAADSGAVLVSDGLAEYESSDDGSIAVTLVRAVGELSRADLPERPGHAGWPARTPGLQSIGPYEARFAVRLVPADSPDVREEIERFAEDELLPITGETLRSTLLEPRRGGGLELHAAGFAFSAAAPAQREGWIMLRCVNQRDVGAEGEWRVSRHVGEAVRARLDETPLGALPVNDGVVRFSAGPNEIVTILIR